ncbi:Gfo/Idh/MocA family protein [Liquorilactobacillus oeni]|uniref:Oxidoreductase n=1 Tax=Liquorilactobacillus oeni DSM 19972 TaxID=1423777 RepID=A0A0R1MFU3_9LACO|nr:Gfo/Idh/MocA family oxidoreductase [Liquorilactobacillus oeni]KRL04018.1 oxidoreductase [Liquorilactobacillus oeni DSM 19972]
MLKLGVIGTGWITKQFIDATQEVGGWKLTSVFSRRLEKANDFAKQFKGEAVGYRDLDTFFQEGDFDVVYIASPNSLHFSQARQAIMADKHVIVEKPACSNPSEMKVLIRLLRRKHHLFYFEAARHFHEENFKTIAQQIKKMKTVQGATLTYMKYSSHYDDFLAGKEPNVFSPVFSGGALQDLGVYLVYDAVAWFGVPIRAVYFPHKLRNGIDGKGIAILQYPGFEVTLNFGKTANSYLASEVYGMGETIWMNNAADLQKVELIDKQGNKNDITKAVTTNPMITEVKNFTAVLQSSNSLANKQLMEDWLAVAVQVNRVMYDLRQSAHINFRSDYEFR